MLIFNQRFTEYSKAKESFSALLFTRSWREDVFIDTFSKTISDMGNVNTLVQDLNSGRCVHFL